MVWWVTEAYKESPIVLYSWIFWVIFSIVCHELAHGWAAIRVGDDTPIHTGHMTWNPVVHMGSTSLIMFGLFGFCWGAMPVSPHRFRGKYADAFVAFAGPLMNLAQFLVLVTVCVLWLVFATRVEQPLRENAIRFLFTGAMLNMVFFVFNLIPLPPLDGSAILANFSRGYRNLLTTEFGQVGAFIGMALLFMSGGSKVWLFAGSATNAVISIGLGLFTKTP
ncbi:MAG: site-2 protease family protein [Planctomycetota bacterium]|nr:site-2 protease family protein [Planctomycetota bacterium]